MASRLCCAAQQIECKIRPTHSGGLIRHGQILDRLRLSQRFGSIRRNNRVQPGIGRLRFPRCLRRSGGTAAGPEQQCCQQQADELFQLHAWFLLCRCSVA